MPSVGKHVVRERPAQIWLIFFRYGPKKVFTRGKKSEKSPGKFGKVFFSTGSAETRRMR